MIIKGRAKCIPKDREAIFLPFQSQWIQDESRIKLMEKSRQIGISWSTAYGADERASAQGARFDEWVSSRDDIQARLFIEDCKLWAGIMGMAAKDLGEVVLDAEKKHSAYVLQFASGRRIHSMSSNPDAQAGKRGSRVLDEFALHREQRKMWAIAYPGITWGGSMELISTHRGSHSFFNQLVREARHGGMLPIGQTTTPASFAEAAPGPAQPDALDALIDAEQAQWRPAMDPLVDPIRALLADAAARGQSAAELLARLPELLPQLNADELATSLTRVAFAARLAGDAGMANG